MSKPTVVFVPGAWHTPEVYNQVMELLKNYDYPTIGLPLPSVGATPAHTDFLGDVKCIRDCITELVNGGKEVMLVSHSYAGMPATEAPIGLGKKAREEKGLPGGVVRLIYIMAFAMPEGFQPTAGGAQFPDWMIPDMEVSIPNLIYDCLQLFRNDSHEEPLERSCNSYPQKCKANTLQRSFY